MCNKGVRAHRMSRKFRAEFARYYIVKYVDDLLVSCLTLRFKSIDDILNTEITYGIFQAVRKTPEFNRVQTKVKVTKIKCLHKILELTKPR